MDKRTKTRQGEIYTINGGYKIKILGCRNKSDCTIEFLDSGLILDNIRYQHIVGNSVKNPLHRRVYGVGYIGVGKYNSKTINNNSKAYDTWFRILERCYCPKAHKKWPSYQDVTVCEEWHNFQNFAAWYEENYVEGWYIDKDILYPDCRLYSPETCCFVPREVNSLFTVKKKAKWPTGVEKRRNIFEVYVRKNNKSEYLGQFNTPEEAYEVYKKAKEDYIKEVADRWKSQISSKVYEAMYAYKIP